MSRIRHTETDFELTTIDRHALDLEDVVRGDEPGVLVYTSFHQAHQRLDGGSQRVQASAFFRYRAPTPGTLTDNYRKRRKSVARKAQRWQTDRD